MWYKCTTMNLPRNTCPLKLANWVRKDLIKEAALWRSYRDSQLMFQMASLLQAMWKEEKIELFALQNMQRAVFCRKQMLESTLKTPSPW